jgi:hypothetical protein
MSRALRLKIELLGTSPSVWRRIEVLDDGTFWDLHVAIQDSMGWSDSHLHAFTVRDAAEGHTEIGIPDPESETGVIAGWELSLSKLIRNPGDRFVYEYDFGDSWLHSVVLEEAGPVVPDIEYPRCVGGERKCPPEDCGGPPGFEEFLEAIADPDHDEHESLLSWSGGSYDPEEFDPGSVHFDDPEERLKSIM